LFVAERALNAAIAQLEPERRILADRYQGDPLDCIGGVLNDLTADSRGGAYFTMGGLFYAAADGAVTRYGEDLATNGVILSPGEETLYVTNGGTIAAFDVAADGSLANQREFVALENGGTGDGLAVDAEGRLYVTGQPGVHVISPDGAYLGLVPTPRGVITAAFSGPDRRTLFAVANNRAVARVYSIPMLAEGFAGRAK
jgi:gluconolactonase